MMTASEARMHTKNNIMTMAREAIINRVSSVIEAAVNDGSYATHYSNDKDYDKFEEIAELLKSEYGYIAKVVDNAESIYISWAEV